MLSRVPRTIADFETQCGAIALDYSINFTPAKSESIPQLHERVAERMYNLLTKNGGLYIKIGACLVHTRCARY